MSAEEPPRFFDLRNLASRLEANQGRNEQFSRDLTLISPVIELCKGQHSAQLERSRALIASDLDCAHQSGFRGRKVRRRQLHQKLATHPVHLSIKPVLPGFLDRGELRIQRGQSGLHSAGFCLALREQGRSKWCK